MSKTAFKVLFDDLPEGCLIFSVERGACDTTVMVFRESDSMYFGVNVIDGTSAETAQAEVAQMYKLLRGERGD